MLAGAIVLFILPACQPKKTSNILTDYAVFQPLDGRWKGEFKIYRDTLGQRDGIKQPREISSQMIQTLPLKEILVIQVEQEYISESPTFQSVTIWDTYPTPEGNTKTVISKGYNNIVGGELSCWIKKPDEVVRHKGTLLDPSIILWERSETEPLKIEFFKETVEKNQYEIVGWGYYEGDNPDLTPQTWFYGLYHKIQ